METAVSVASKPVLKKYIITQQLNQEMLDTIYDYSLTLRVSESTKELYLQRLRMFGLWLMKQGIKRFIGVEKGHINCFLATYDKNNTKNGYITALRPFYRDFLNKPNVVEGLKYYAEELEPITPSDVLTSNEVIVIAEKAGERREMYKVIILSLFESCARVNELLHLKKGDVRFHSVTDKEGHRKLIATLYFKRIQKKRKSLFVRFAEADIRLLVMALGVHPAEIKFSMRDCARKFGFIKGAFKSLIEVYIYVLCARVPIHVCKRLSLQLLLTR